MLGKKVKQLRLDGIIPGHVFGNKIETEHVAVKLKDFLPIMREAGETGLIDLKIGAEKVRPVMIRGTQYDPRSDNLLHIDFYQVDLKEKVTVPVPLVLEGEEPESVHMGEAVVLQTMGEVEVEALPTDLVDKIAINISVLKKIDDAVTVGQLNYDRSKLTVLADPDEVVVKLAPAVTEEMKQLLEEQAAEAQAAAEEQAAEEGAEAPPTEEKVEGEDKAEKASEDQEEPKDPESSR